MKIKDYTYADCTLFRQPPVDFSIVQQAIEKNLLDLWERGYSANSSIDYMLENNELLGQLTDQVAENLQFQREQMLSNIEVDKEGQILTYEEEKERNLQAIRTSLGRRAEDKNGEYEKTNQEYVERRTSCDAVSQRLEEMRRRIQDKYKRLGGEKGYQNIVELTKLTVSGAAAAEKQEGSSVEQEGASYRPSKRRAEDKPFGEKDNDKGKSDFFTKAEEGPDRRLARPNLAAYNAFKAAQEKEREEKKQLEKCKTNSSEDDSSTTRPSLEGIVQTEGTTDKKNQSGFFRKVWKVLNTDVTKLFGDK